MRVWSLKSMLSFTLYTLAIDDDGPRRHASSDHSNFESEKPPLSVRKISTMYSVRPGSCANLGETPGFGESPPNQPISGLVIFSTVIAEIFVRVKISYSSVCQLSYSRNFHGTATVVSDTHANVYGFRMLLNFVLSAESTKLNRVRNLCDYSKIYQALFRAVVVVDSNMSRGKYLARVASNQALPALDTSHATCCYWRRLLGKGPGVY